MIAHVYVLTIDDLCTAWASRAEVRRAVDAELAAPLSVHEEAHSEPNPLDPHDAERVRKYGPNPFAAGEAAHRRALDIATEVA